MASQLTIAVVFSSDVIATDRVVGESEYLKFDSFSEREIRDSQTVNVTRDDRAVQLRVAHHLVTLQTKPEVRWRFVIGRASAGGEERTEI